MDKPPLRRYLVSEIMREGFITLDKAHAIARSFGHKESNVERRLRPSESPNIETIYRDGVVIGYKYAKTNTETMANPLGRTLQTSGSQEGLL